MTEFNKVFCMAPWVHMNVNCNGDVYPCCMLPILETEENEDTDKMKKLFNYKYSDSMGKTNNYSEETDTFKNLFESTKGKTLL